MFNNSNPLRNNVVALWLQAGLRKFAYRKMGYESVKKRTCLSAASSCALAFGGHFFSKFTTAGVLFFASFLFVQAKRNEENAIKNAKLECFLFFLGVQ